MTEQQTAAMKLALEALEQHRIIVWPGSAKTEAERTAKRKAAITALRQALEQQPADDDAILPGGGYVPPVVVKRPQPAAPAIPLTREQVKGLCESAGYDMTSMQERADFINGIRHAEAAHGITQQKDTP